MRIDDLTPIEKRIIIIIRQTTKGLLTIPIAQGIIQEPEIKLPICELEKLR